MRSAARIALFIDFDGTLAPIRRWPKQVRLERNVRGLLEVVAKSDATLGVISGRRITDVRTRVGLGGIWYVGVHGYVLRGPSGKVKMYGNEEALARMRTVRRRLAAQLCGMPGVVVETKEATVAAHYRNASPATRRAARKVIQGLLESHPQLHLLSGKMVWELLPDSRTSKWTAIRRILMQERLPCPGRWLVFYLGDDSTDERVFEKLQGISVVVGRRRRTAARYYLRSTAEVREFLERFCEVGR
ncbi:MAG: trehalose-phosphatase [Acidobacteria bacterium]|nr:trehalose-phosphatase [Acidobacteriota bacterium]